MSKISFAALARLVFTDLGASQHTKPQIVFEFKSAAYMEQGASHVPVELQFLSNMVKIFIEDSGKYVGLLDPSGLSDLIRAHDVTLAATFSCPKDSKGRNSGVSQTNKTLNVVVYGLRSDMNDIGDLLEGSGLYLQHPREYDTRHEYLNPQYLLRPGSSMPRVEDVAFHALQSQPASDRALEMAAKSEVHRVFDSASGPSSFSSIIQSSRLRTLLKEYVDPVGNETTGLT